MSPDFTTANIMPASSADPVSVALEHSLNGSRKRFSNEELDQKLVGSAKRVLLTAIQYEESTSYDTSILENLKSKYIVLSAKNCENSEIKIKNGFKESHKENKIPSMNKTDILPKPKRVLYPPEKIQLGWQSSTPIGAGLINLGNTCYLNSTLQALFHIPAFVNWLLSDNIHAAKCESMNGMTHTECLICAMKKTLQFSHHNSGSSIKPIQIYNKLKLICKHLVHGHQEDAHEFLRYLIESMEKSYLTILQANNLDSYSKETTPLNQIFGGYIRTEVTCLECRHVSITFSHFQDLLLDIRQASSVDDALESYFSRERLGEGEEAYKCEQCHKRVAATKKFSIERPPKVLCVQLKRFGIMGGKNSKHISMTQTLDLTKFCHRDSLTGQRFRYRLVSLVTHIGPSANCGHYTALGQTSEGRFYQFDDSSVRFVSDSILSSTNAYIIMYEMEPPQPGLFGNKIPASLAVSTNGMNGKSLQNGTSNTTPQKPSVMKIAFFNKSPHTSQSQSPSTSSSTSLTPKRMKPTDTNGENKSLVPYTANESSDSETDQQPSTSKQNHTPTMNGTVKETLKKPMCLVVVPPKNNTVKQCTVVKSNVSYPLTVKTNGVSANGLTNGKEQNGDSVNKWHVTEVSNHSPSNSVGHSVTGSWSITETNGNVEKNGIQKEQSPNKQHTENRLNNGNGRTWDGSRQSETVGSLLKMSHRGYGNNVTNWEGGRTQIDREAENDRLTERKRFHDQSCNDDLDSGKVKKVKNDFSKNNNYRSNNRYGKRYNSFQEYQNRKNSWHNNRQQFYRQYSNHQYNKSHKNHHNHNNYQNRYYPNRWH